jgi:hypothetical protein
VTTVGLLTSGDSQPYVNSACSSSSFFGIHFPQPVSLSEIDWSHSHGGSGPSDGDVISLWFYGATAAWTGCWRSTDGHWYRESNNALCDSEQLLPGQGYWYTARNSSVTFTIPKPYSNP